MSRYSADLPNGRTLVWGFDNPLGEYFVQEFYTTLESFVIDQENEEGEKPFRDPEVLYSIMSHTTTVPHPDHPEQMDYANSEILEILEKYHITDPIEKALLQQHMHAIAMDLTF